MPKLVWKPGALLAPVPPALVSCGTLERPNALTVAWTGVVCSEPPMLSVSIRPERHSYGIIRESGEFVVNLVSRPMARACDYCGVRSGAREPDKVKNAGLTVMAASQVAAPLIAKSPLALECRVRQVLPLGSHDLFLADIVAVDADEQYVDAQGRLRLDKADLIAYSHGEYFALGDLLGGFGFSVRKKPANAKKRPAAKRKNPPKA